LRKLVLENTGQDLRKCRGCLACDLNINSDVDISLGSLVQLVLMNDSDILTSKLLWDDDVVQMAKDACTKNLKLQDVMISLRKEKIKQDLEKRSEEFHE
jgi:heterodisulfide reductase subunit C